MIRITRAISIDESEIQEDFVRASGPGGQNVNKVATAVQLRFDAAHSPSLTDDVRQRLMNLAGARMTSDGVLLIDAQRYRTRERNREDAVNRLADMIRKAAQKPRKRRKTRPTRASKQRRLDAKRHSAKTRQTRGRVSPSDD